MRTFPRGHQAARRCPREHTTEVGNFLVSLREGMASILMPQGALRPYQLPARLGGAPRQTAFPAPSASEAAAAVLLPPVVTGLWPLASCVRCTPTVPGTVRRGGETARRRDGKLGVHAASAQLSALPRPWLGQTHAPAWGRRGLGRCHQPAPGPSQGLTFSLFLLTSNLRA